MKNLILLVALALPVLLSSQVIDSAYLTEYIVMKNGAKTEVNIVDDDDDFVYIERNGAKNKVPKSSLSDWKTGNLWEQPFAYNEKGDIEYVEVIELPGIAKDEVYLRAKKMFISLFKDSRNVLEYDDKEAGTLIGNGNTSVSWVTQFMDIPVSITMWFTLTIDVKEGKYRLTLNNFENQAPVSQYSNGDRYGLEIAFPENEEVPKLNREMKAAALTEIDALFKQVKKTMAEKPAKDW